MDIYTYYFNNDIIDYLNLERNKKYTIRFITECTLNRCTNINKVYKMDNNFKNIISNVEINESVTIGSLVELAGYWKRIWNNGISKSTLKNIIKKKIKLLNIENHDVILDNFSIGRQVTTIVV